jgi:Family of unknown function (DUF5317)
MFILAFFVLAVLSVPLAGGRLSALGRVEIRGTSFVVGALAVQILIIEIVPASLPESVAEALHLASYALAATFIARNLRIPGVWMVALGGLLNVVVIAANGGVMPAAPEALAAAGMPLAREAFANSTALAEPVLWWLGDVFAIPHPLPVANVFSVGDVILCLGGAVGLHVLAGSRLAGSAARAAVRELDDGAAVGAAVDGQPAG